MRLPLRRRVKLLNVSAPPILNYSDEPPGSRLTCRRDGDDLIIMLPQQRPMRVLTALVSSQPIPLIIVCIVAVALSYFTAHLLHRFGSIPALAGVLPPVFWLLVLSDRAGDLAQMELTIKLRPDRLWLNYIHPAAGPRPQVESTIVTHGSLQAQRFAARTIVRSWPRDEIEAIDSFFGRLRIRGKRDAGRRTPAYIEGLTPDERRWLIRILSRRLQLESS